ncbi:uncharacterized protein LOC112557819 [Pomacea canaliculata]|uniref:uncharacterized protein LOC112557819 n=1 Tax=Pomacea canaliculata TaxID=400727 RepID=UPI000D72A99C|nr:uncharacterized protein LOC112557819 [Pomacea canaliculata]
MAAAGLLTLGTALLIATTLLQAQSESIDIKTEARAVVANVRDFVLRTKEETSIETILQNILRLQSITVNLIAHLPANRISECETQTVIKLAAAGIGSHEVLDVLLAEDDTGVLGARIRLSLAFLNRLAQHLDDKLSLSSDVGPELTAITFGANTTAAIITISGSDHDAHACQVLSRGATNFAVSNEPDSLEVYCWGWGGVVLALLL